jgi:hypothetical protein
MISDGQISQGRIQRTALVGGLTLSFVAVVLCLLVGELGVRLFEPAASLWRYPNLATLDRKYNHIIMSPHMRYDELLGHQPLEGVAGMFMGRPISFSADGLRNHNLNLAPRQGPVVLAVGDSFTEGWAVGDDETWPAHLERDTGWPVLNAGVRGYGLDQMVLRAERLAPRFKPRVIVLAFIPDDIYRVGLSIRQAYHKPYFVPAGETIELRDVPVPRTPVSDGFDAVRRVLGYSYLIDFVMRRLDAVDLWHGDTFKSGVDGDLVSCRLMGRFAALARREDAKGLIVAFPEDLANVGPRDAATSRAGAARMLDCARRAGLATLDADQGFAAAGAQRDPESFYFDRHFTDRGNALAARLIASVLEGVGTDRR